VGGRRRAERVGRKTGRRKAGRKVEGAEAKSLGTSKGDSRLSSEELSRCYKEVWCLS